MLLERKTITGIVTPAKIQNALEPLRIGLRNGFIDQDNFVDPKTIDAIVDIPTSGNLFTGNIREYSGQKIVLSDGEAYRFARWKQPLDESSDVVADFLWLDPEEFTGTTYYWGITSAIKFAIYTYSAGVFTQVGITDSAITTSGSYTIATDKGIVYFYSTPVETEVSLRNKITVDETVSPYIFLEKVSRLLYQCDTYDYLVETANFNIVLTKDTISENYDEIRKEMREQAVEVANEYRNRNSITQRATPVWEYIYNIKKQTAQREEKVRVTVGTRSVLIDKIEGYEFESFNVSVASRSAVSDDKNRVNIQAYVKSETETQIELNFDVTFRADFQLGETESFVFAGTFEVLFRRKN